MPTSVATTPSPFDFQVYVNRRGGQRQLRNPDSFPREIFKENHMANSAESPGIFSAPPHWSEEKPCFREKGEQATTLSNSFRPPPLGHSGKQAEGTDSTSGGLKSESSALDGCVPGRSVAGGVGGVLGASLWGGGKCFGRRESIYVRMFQRKKEPKNVGQICNDLRNL